MKNSRKILSILACFCMSMAFSNASASDLLNGKPLLKDVVAGNPGMELIAPWFQETVDGDDYPTQIKFRFNVYAAGTKTKQFGTPVRTFVPPAFPCQNPVWGDWDWDAEFIGEGNSHTGITVMFEVECEEQNGPIEEAYATFVYMADTSQAGSGWSKTYSKSLISVHIVDWDDDQEDEVMLALSNETETSEKLTALILDKMTGQEESNKTYTLGQIISAQ